MCPKRTTRALRSEHVDRWKRRVVRDAALKEKGRTHVSRPQRVATATECGAALPHLVDGHHGEGTSAFEPYRIASPPMELEESVAVAACPMTKVGTFGQWPGLPDELSTIAKRLVEDRNGERGTCKGCDDPRCTMAVLAQDWCLG